MIPIKISTKTYYNKKKDEKRKNQAQKEESEEKPPNTFLIDKEPNTARICDTSIRKTNNDQAQRKQYLMRTRHWWCGYNEKGLDFPLVMFTLICRRNGTIKHVFGFYDIVQSNLD